MANLTQTSSVARKVFNGFLMVLAATILFFIVVKVGAIVRNAYWPVTFPPSIAFGKLPPLDISEGIKPPENVNYSIETIKGGLPKLPKDAKVFTVAVNTFYFGNISDVQKKAAAVGFGGKPTIIDTTKAVFIKNDNGFNSLLQIDLLNGTFNFKSDYATNAGVLTGNPPPLGDAQNISGRFLANFGLSSAEFPLDKVSPIYYKIEGTNLIKTPTSSGANLMQVNFNRGDIDKIPVYYPRAVNPELWTLMSNGNIVTANSYVWLLQKYKFATYPLKGIDVALQELKEGKAIWNKLLSDDDPAAPIPQTQFHIFDAGLGYLITEKLQPYLQPVYVFKGDKGQNAYVPAIDESWIDKSLSSTK